MSLTELINIAIERGLLSIKRDPPQTLSEFADSCFYLSSGSSYVQGAWKSYPFQTPILDIMGNDEIEEVDFLKAARVGFSKMLLAFIAYNQVVKKRNQAIYLAGGTSANNFSKTQVDAALTDIPIFRSIFSKSYGKKCANNTIGLKQFENGTTLRILNGSTARSYRELSLDVAMLDEYSGFEVTAEGEPALLAKKRTSGSSTPKLICGSTPRKRGACLMTDRYEKNEIKLRFFIPCPYCEVLHPLTWSGMIWTKDLPETVLHHCPSCGAGYGQDEYLRVWERGRMQTDEGVYYTGGLFYDSQNQQIAMPEKLGIHVWAAYSPMQSWQSLVKEWLTCYKDPALLTTFINTTLGEPDEDGLEGANPTELQSRAEEFYRVPNEAVALTIGVDVQSDRLEFEMVAWNECEESWSILYEVLWGNPLEDAVWHELSEYITSNYERENGEMLPISMCLIDSGFLTHRVYECIDRMGLTYVYASRGMDGKRPVIEHERDRTRRALKSKRKGGHAILVGVDQAKTIIYQRMGIAESGAGYMHIPKTRHIDWYEQLTVEQLKTTYQRGFSIQKWIKPDGARNEALDCRVYAYAAFKMLAGKYRILNQVSSYQRRVRQR
ncbi:MAG: phage terminase large subunit family protein [Methylococcales bacterium]|nr:phage terminase large subunit family protein [Methylococcales bacterium]